MARFNQSAPYSGKGQKAQLARAASLIGRGLLPAGDYSVGTPGARKAITEAEKAAGLIWHQDCGDRAVGHYPGKHS